MNHKEEMEELHRQSLSKFEDYLSKKEKITEEDHKKLKELKDDWQVTWNKIMETMLVLERLEI